MNNLELLKSQLNDINTKRVRIQTLVEQAQKQCQEIEQKYNVKSLEELKALVDKAELDYQIMSLKVLDFSQYPHSTILVKMS